MKQNITSPDNLPRSIEACSALTPSQRFRIMNQINALPSYEDKKAFGAADPNKQAQLLLEALLASDQQRNGSGGHPAPMQMAPQQAPQMAAPQMVPQMVPQMPPMPTPQAPQQAPQMAPQMAPQQPPQMGGQMTLPGTSGGMPRMPGPGMPGLPGMPRPAPQQAQQTRSAASDDGRDPAPPKAQGTLQKAAAAVTPNGPSGAILKKLVDNNEEIIATLSKVAEGDLESIEMLKSIHMAVLGNSQMITVLLTILVDFYEGMAQQGRENFTAKWANSIQSGSVAAFLQELGQSGKG